jgi:hypothetical protein
VVFARYHDGALSASASLYPIEAMTVRHRQRVMNFGRHFLRFLCGFHCIDNTVQRVIISASLSVGPRQLLLVPWISMP